MKRTRSAWFQGFLDAEAGTPVEPQDQDGDANYWADYRAGVADYHKRLLDMKLEAMAPLYNIHVLARTPCRPKQRLGVVFCLPCHGTGDVHREQGPTYRRCALCSGSGVIPE